MNKVLPVIDFGNINPGSSVANLRFQNLPDFLNVKDYDENELNIFFSARNGTWNQTLKIKRVRRSGKNSIWAQAIQVKADNDTYEIVDKLYPRNSTGKIDW